MWPWGHAAVGYLSYVGIARARGWEAPDGRLVLAALVGSQLPDLVDKPLAWTFEILPSGRSLGHSLLAVALVVAIVWWLDDDDRWVGGIRPIWVAFVVGWVSHIFADGLHAAAAGRFSELSYAVWPLLPLPSYSTDPSFLAHLQTLRVDASLIVELTLCVIALGLWYRRRSERDGLGSAAGSESA